ncbi:deoxyribose-phosphate aldolase [Halomicrobium sp. IBSBa]|uniref:deoxyribose-phosphate aldolase n=1 Tax=Halomicrobium sp. IBSBa TaxID=2778916 RepID=UPI001ABF34BD|nr:deoxyribose-phosphate aldolase [Halomicrobium sp. IBSBa]MBO4249334.1 deoxyribose-phosphate aldolase [Halomicrobium sp. IBSBa]
MDSVPERIEHTVLGPTTRWADVQAVLDDATEHGLRACIPPCYVARADEYADVPLSTVVNFPHGQGATDAVAAAAKQAWDDGADEIDMVCNVGQLKAGADAAVTETIAEVVATVPVPVKVIVEAPLLTDAEKHRAGEIVAEAGAEFCKTATGFSDGGATVADVALLSQYRPVKASGGVGSWERAKAMFDAGAERIGASSGVTIAEEWRAAEGGASEQ